MEAIHIKINKVTTFSTRLVRYSYFVNSKGTRAKSFYSEPIIQICYSDTLVVVETCNNQSNPQGSLRSLSCSAHVRKAYSVCSCIGHSTANCNQFFGRICNLQNGLFREIQLQLHWPFRLPLPHRTAVYCTRGALYIRLVTALVC